MTEISKIESLFDDMNKEMEVLRASYQERGQKIFKEAFKEFFKNTPEATVVGWRQATPYFNDGEPCEFSCYAEYAFVSNATDYDSIQYGEYDGDDEETVWIEDPDYGDCNEELIPQHVHDNAESLRRLLSKVSEDIYLDMFGDHVIVRATREGFDVTTYDHD